MVAVLLFFLYSEMINIAQKPWSVVYAANGKVYIGKVVNFPSFQLFEPYSVDIVQDPEKEEGQLTFRLTPLSEVIWAPEKLDFNREQVIFSGPLDKNSRAWKAIEEERQER